MIKNKQNKTNKHITKIVALFAIAMICFACSVVGAVGFAKETTLTNVELESYYNIGQQIVISDGTLTVDGQNYTVKPTVEYPDGTVYVKNNYELNQLGKYSVVYGKEIGGKFYSVEKEFQVYDYLFSNSATNETFYYGSDYQESLVDADPAKDRSLLNGLRFDLLQGEELRYNKVIDLNDYEKDDALIKLDAVPLETQKRDASTLYIILTDVYDSSNVVTIRIRKAPDSPNVNYSYINAAYADKPLEGYVNGAYYYGVGFDNGLNGRTKSTPHIDIRFDYVSKCIYSYNTMRNGLVLIKDMINDYGNEPWGGFTTGEVWLSIYASGYASTDVTAPFHGMLLEIDGQNLTDKEEGTFSSSVVTKTNSQNIDFGEYESEENIPNAMVGFSYKVFDTDFLPIYGGEKLYTNVYYAYTSSSRYEVPVVNGYFTPDKVGVYTIVYSVVDVFGNVSTTSVDVTAIADNGYGIYVEVPTYENYLTGQVGEKVDLAGADEVVTVGSLGNVDVTITATNSKGKVVDITNNDFVPGNGGDWLITYTVKDYAGRIGKFSYNLEVQVSDKVVFGEVTDMLKYFVVGTPNPVPAVEYIDYNQANPAYKPVKTVYAEKDGERVGDVVDGYFTPETAGEYYIVYEQTSSVNTEEPNYKKVPVLAIDVMGDNEMWDKSKYFYTSTDSIVSNSMDDKGSVITVDGNGTFEFIRPVDASSFDITFEIDKVSKVVGDFSIILTDMNNADEQIKISFINNGASTNMLINETKEVILKSRPFKDTSFTLNIKNGIATVGSDKGNIDNYLNGAPYKGFSSLFVYLTFEVGVDLVVDNVNDTYDHTAIHINDINGQPMSGRGKTADVITPRLVTSESYLNKVNAGQIVKIPYSKVIDVLTPKATATLTIKGPDNNAVRDTSGKLLQNVSIEEDYYILLEKSGTYKLYYSYEDASGNMNYAKYPNGVVVAVSREKPVISISGGDRSGKVGEAFNVGTATCTGEFNSYTLYIFVQGPTGNLKKVEMVKGEPNYMQHVAKEKGVYRVLYVARDEWDNMATAEYFVKVS